MDPEDIRSAAPRRSCPLHVEIVVEAPEWQSVAGLAPAIEAAAWAAHDTASARSSPAEVTIALLSNAALRELNRRYRGQDRPTNVLSFPAGGRAPAADGGPAPLGDLALAWGTVAREAGERGISLLDHVRHLTVHGVLHLLGHDHESETEAVGMEALELRILARLGVADPHADTEPAQDRVLE